ncbi:MAG: HAMP domain-containing protein [Betaproteobacteria bacterium]|nr:HAMP domain-containing protein [Betaproteobacteria bacterium]
MRLLKSPLHYPRSFLKLITVGFALVALPLILAIINNAVSINDITKRSQLTVHQAMRATDSTRRLIEELTAMERSVRQATALDDPSLLAGFAHAHVKFVESARDMLALKVDPEQQRQLRQLMEKEARLAAAVNRIAVTPDLLSALFRDFDELDILAHRLADLATTIVEREVASLESMAEGVQHFVFWQLVALVPMALIVLVGSIILISRPIAQIDAAIRRLGDGNFTSKVEVNGPQDLQNLGRQLDWMRLKLIDLEGQKRLFLHHVSHELKTPLAAIKEGSGLLDEELVGPLTSSQREVTAILKQNTHRLQELIERLLNYHETQFNRPALNLGEVRLPDVISAVSRQHQLTLSSKGVDLVVNCPPVSLEADREKLGAIVGNLVSNAAKYAPQNGRIEVGVTEREDGIRIEVADDGPGIRAEERPYVFEPFFHGSTQHDGAMKGTGLGLAIVREFVLAHHGRIEIVDQEAGTRIRVDLPRRQPPMREAA